MQMPNFDEAWQIFLDTHKQSTGVELEPDDQVPGHFMQKVAHAMFQAGSSFGSQELITEMMNHSQGGCCALCVKMGDDGTVESVAVMDGEQAEQMAAQHAAEAKKSWAPMNGKPYKDVDDFLRRN